MVVPVEQGTCPREDRIRDLLELNRLVFARSRLASAEVWAEAEITLVQLKVLLLLLAEKQLSVSGVSARLGVHISTAGQLLDRMVRQGLIVRHPDDTDRRVIVARLSEAGERLLQRLYGNNPSMVAAINRLSDQELDALYTGMKALARETGRAESLADEG